MNINLRDVTLKNLVECINLSVTEEQKKIFRAPVVNWIAESKFVKEFQLLAIYNENTVVGFAIYLTRHNEKDNHYYWIEAFMIDKNYQQKGYGKEAMIKIIDFLKNKDTYSRIKLGHRPINYTAAVLYESLGFKVTEENDNEVIRCLDIG